MKPNMNASFNVAGYLVGESETVSDSHDARRAIEPWRHQFAHVDRSLFRLCATRCAQNEMPDRRSLIENGWLIRRITGQRVLDVETS